MRVNGILSFLSFYDVCSDDCRSSCWARRWPALTTETGLSLHLGTTESRKNLEQKFIFQIGILNPHGINERFSFN